VKSHSSLVAEACPLPELKVIIGLRVQEGTRNFRENRTSVRSIAVLRYRRISPFFASKLAFLLHTEKKLLIQK